MVFVKADEEVINLLMKEGFTTTHDLNQAQVAVAEIPEYMATETGLPLIFVLRKTIDYGTYLEASTRTKVVALHELGEAIRELLKPPQSTNSIVLDFGSNSPPPLPEVSTAIPEPPAPIKNAKGLTAVPQTPPTPVEKPWQSKSDFFSNRYRRRAKVVASFSTKGGVGKTSVAMNVCAFQAKQGKKAILIDMDLTVGNYKELLGVSYDGPTVVNWRQYALNLLTTLKRHTSTGMYVLPGGETNLTEIPGSEVEDLIDVLSNQLDFIVMDFGTTPNHAHTKAGLALADKIYAVADTKQGMMRPLLTEFLLKYPDWVKSGKTELVVNMVRPDSFYTAEQLAKEAGTKRYHEIPDDSAFEVAKKSMKTVIELKNSPAGQALKILASEWLDEPIQQEAPKKPGFFSRVFGGGRN
jgi:MinD-like ATPase involved in chromosome partitioning or flagellar assembly